MYISCNLIELTGLLMKTLSETGGLGHPYAPYTLHIKWALPRASRAVCYDNNVN